MLAIHRLKVETFHHFVSEHRPSREIHYFTQSRRLRVRRRASSFSHLTGHRMAWECRTRESGHSSTVSIGPCSKRIRVFVRSWDRLGLNKFTILSVGRLVPHKNHELLVTAVSRLRDVTLLIVGRGPSETRISKLAKELNVDLRLMGYLEREDLVRVYNASDVLVQVSKVEGFFSVVLEALSCGLPVVSSDVADIAKLRDKGVVMDRSRTPEELSKTIGRLMSRSVRCDTVVGDSMFWDSYSWSRSAVAHLMAYKRLQGIAT